MISTIILTKNEEQDLPKCLESLTWCEDVHVLDSGSTDNTIRIAEDHGAYVHHHPFASFGKQRNYALDNLPLENEWVIFLDADEVVTRSFKGALIDAVTQAPDEIAGFYCCWKMMLDDVWLKRSDNFPKWQFRVLRKKKARFTDFGHGQKEGKVDGQIDYIKEPYLHYGFSKGWSQWIDRHNRYSSLEAIDRLQNYPPFKNNFSSTKSIRNPALKSWLSRVPGWPALRFLYSYVLNFGFLEGMPGFIYCVNIAYYEFLIQIKMKELKKKAHNV